MYIGVVLLFQAYFAHPILFRVLMLNFFLILKIRQKLKDLVLMMKLLMQKLGNQPWMMTGHIVLVEAKILVRVTR